MGNILRWMAFEIRVWSARRIEESDAVNRGDEVEIVVSIDEVKERGIEKERVEKSR